MNWNRIYKLVAMWSFLFLWLSPPTEHRSISNDFWLRHSKRKLRHKHGLDLERLKVERLEAIKMDILAKLDMDRVPDVTLNASRAELRDVMAQFEENVARQEGTQHVIFDDDEFDAKEFHQFKLTGQYISISIKICIF